MKDNFNFLPQEAQEKIKNFTTTIQHFSQKSEFTIIKNNTVKNTLVSIIIPIYNTEQYLQQCLDSVRNQTLTNIEIICINDGSSDSCLDIVLKNANQDNRITVCNQTNSGASVARNNGLNIAKSNYIYFMDSDDILEIYALEYLYKEAETKELDLINFDAEVFNSGSKALEERMKILNNGRFNKVHQYNNIYTGIEYIAVLKQNNEYAVSPWSYFIKRELLTKNNIRYIPGIVYEDNAFCFSILIHAQRITYISKKLYKYRLLDNSVSNSPCTFFTIYSLLQILKYSCNEVNQLNINIQKQNIVYKIITDCIWIIRDIYSSLDNYEKLVRYALPFSDKLLLKNYILCNYDFYEDVNLLAEQST